jgi:hypothetical protein
VARAVKHLLCKHEALTSNPVAPHKKNTEWFALNISLVPPTSPWRVDFIILIGRWKYRGLQWYAWALNPGLTGSKTYTLKWWHYHPYHLHFPNVNKLFLAISSFFCPNVGQLLSWWNTSLRQQRSKCMLFCQISQHFWKSAVRLMTRRPASPKMYGSLFIFTYLISICPFGQVKA